MTFFDVVGVVPLETTDECLLGYVSKVEVVDGNYYVLDANGRRCSSSTDKERFCVASESWGTGTGEYERASDLR